MFFQSFLQFLVDVLKVPSILVGLVALFGLVAQKKSLPDVIKGTIKTILGFLFFLAGRRFLLGLCLPWEIYSNRHFMYRGSYLTTRPWCQSHWKNMVRLRH